MDIYWTVDGDGGIRGSMHISSDDGSATDEEATPSSWIPVPFSAATNSRPRVETHPYRPLPSSRASDSATQVPPAAPAPQMVPAPQAAHPNPAPPNPTSFPSIHPNRLRSFEQTSSRANAYDWGQPPAHAGIPRRQAQHNAAVVMLPRDSNAGYDYEVLAIGLRDAIMTYHSGTIPHVESPPERHPYDYDRDPYHYLVTGLDPVVTQSILDRRRIATTYGFFEAFPIAPDLPNQVKIRFQGPTIQAVYSRRIVITPFGTSMYVDSAGRPALTYMRSVPIITLLD